MSTDSIIIITTATKRAELLNRTYQTFHTFSDLPYLSPFIIANVDPVGPDDIQEVVRVVESWGTGGTRVYLPMSPGFGYAFRTVWYSVGDYENQYPYVIYLEDDWELLRSVRFKEIMRFMDDHPDVVSVRLNDKPAGEKDIKTFNRFMPYNDELGCFEVPDYQRLTFGFCGHPQVLRSSFVSKAAKYINPESNPEKQFHRGDLSELVEMVESNRWCIWCERGGGKTVKDIGREWMVENGYRKKGVKAFFTEWYEKEEG
jgi:hypothetical protein